MSLNSTAHIELLAALHGETKIPNLARVLIWVASLITLWAHRRRTRLQLSYLDHHLLNDIGLTREQAEEESMKRFWKP